MFPVEDALGDNVETILRVITPPPPQTCSANLEHSLVFATVLSKSVRTALYPPSSYFAGDEPTTCYLGLSLTELCGWPGHQTLVGGHYPQAWLVVGHIDLIFVGTFCLLYLSGGALVLPFVWFFLRSVHHGWPYCESIKLPAGSALRFSQAHKSVFFMTRSWSMTRPSQENKTNKK